MNIISFIVVVFCLFSDVSNAQNISDSAIRKEIIVASQASYSGNCPCPYNLARNGSKCGKRSAYSRAGGASPTCFDNDVTPKMIAAYKSKRSN